MVTAGDKAALLSAVMGWIAPRPGSDSTIEEDKPMKGQAQGQDQEDVGCSLSFSGYLHQWEHFAGMDLGYVI